MLLNRSQIDSADQGTEQPETDSRLDDWPGADDRPGEGDRGTGCNFGTEILTTGEAVEIRQGDETEQPGETAARATGLRSKLEQEAKERQKDGQQSGGRGHKKNSVENLPPSSDAGKSRDQIGRMFGVSGKTVDQTEPAPPIETSSRSTEPPGHKTGDAETIDDTAETDQDTAAPIDDDQGADIDPPGDPVRFGWDEAHKLYVPSPETIRSECAAIREEWTAIDWYRRAGTPLDYKCRPLRWTPPVVSCAPHVSEPSE